MEQPTHSQEKLNVFALPSQTSILFALIAVVLLSAAVIGSIGPSPILFWPISLSLLVLPLRGFITRPERDVARYKLSPAENDLCEMQQLIETTTQIVGLRRVPQLVVSPDTNVLRQPHVFGTFRHWYFAVNHEAALQLQKDMEDPDIAPTIQAKIIHELYHFKTGDYWQLGYVSELMRLVGWFMLWAALFFCGWIFLLIFATPAILQFSSAEFANQIPNITPELRQLITQAMPSSGEIESLRQKAAGINLYLVASYAINATLPFVVTAFLLWLFYRPKLWRMREFYADAGVVQIQGDIMPFISTLTGIPISHLRKYFRSSPKLETTLNSRKYSLVTALATAWQMTSRLSNVWPSGEDRISCVKDPSRVFGRWWNTAVLIGGLTLMLDVLLSGPLTLMYVGGFPVHFSTLVILTTVSFDLIPAVVLGRHAQSDLLRITAVVLLLRLVWLLLTLALLWTLFIISPKLFSEVLATGVAGIAHFAGYSDQLGFGDPFTFMITASIVNLAQVLILFIVLIASLMAVVFLLKRILTWYGLPQPAQWLMKAAYGVIGLITLFVGLTVLPPITIALLRPSEIFNPTNILLAGVGSVLMLIGVVLFRQLDERYGRKCPNCGKKVGGTFQLGKRCNICRERLHRWLITEYNS